MINFTKIGRPRDIRAKNTWRSESDMQPRTISIFDAPLLIVFCLAMLALSSNRLKPTYGLQLSASFDRANSMKSFLWLPTRPFDPIMGS